VEKYAHAGRYLGIRTQINGDCAELWVEDKGSGIPDAAAKRVFDPFFRVGDSLTEGVSGTGIGLSIARDLARLHGGDLTFERTPSGSRFRLTIPIGPESV
jgi:signal transduction histidine kinase